MNEQDSEIRDLQLSKIENLPDLSYDDKLKVIANFLGYRDMPVDIDTFMNDPYYLGDVLVNLYPFWKEKAKEVFPTPLNTKYPILVFTGGIGCVSGNTNILLADGNTAKIRDLYNTKPYGGFNVYSYDTKSNKNSIGSCTGVYYTGRKSAIELQISSSSSNKIVTLDCTLDHKILTNRGYIEAKDLTSNDIIKSLYLNGDANQSHRLISSKILKDKIDVYDMTVDKYHNYGILDADGNIMYTHNTGKSTFSRVLFEYMKYRVLCLKNVYNTLGFVPGKKIKFSYFHRTGALAQTDFIDVLSGDEGWEMQSPYFKEMWNQGKMDIFDQVADSVRSNNNIGSDVLAYVLSELNFIPYDRAHDKLDQALKRWSSRFDRILKYFGLCIIDTSSQGDDSIADDFILNNPYGDMVMAIHTNRWIVRAHMNYYGKKGWFKVFTGDGIHQPFIIDKSKGRIVTPDMDPDRVIDVPEEVRSDFEFDLTTALQDIAGISVSSTDRFFPDTTELIKCFNLPQYGPDVVKFDFFDKTDKLIYRFDRSIRDIPPDKIIYIRYDIGVTGDNTGLCIGYFDHFKVYDADKKMRQPIITIPLAVGINRYNDTETPIYHLEEFIIDLNKQFEIGMFTADQFASRQLLQNLTLAKIPNQYLSVDRTDEAYVYTKTLANAGCLNIANNELLKREMCDLRRVGNKIDHTPAGVNSKDISDSVSGCVFNIYQHLDTASLLSTKYKAEKHVEFMKERSKKPTDEFQEMIQGLF